MVDDYPVTIKEMLHTFAMMLGAKPPLNIPIWLARFLAGSYAVEFLTSSTRTSNKRLRGETQWAPRFPSYKEGLAQIVATWNTSSTRQRDAVATLTA